MTDNELDIELASWLAAGPTAFPADNRRAILNAVHALPRRRTRARGWQGGFGGRAVIVIGTAAVLVAVGALGLSLWGQLVIAPATTPSPSPSASPMATPHGQMWT